MPSSSIIRPIEAEADDSKREIIPLKKPKSVERDERPAVTHRAFVVTAGPDTDPIDTTIDSQSARQGTEATDSDHRIVTASADAAHARREAEDSVRGRIAGVCALAAKTWSDHHLALGDFYVWHQPALRQNSIGTHHTELRLRRGRLFLIFRSLCCLRRI